ncbi:hypothetical protein LPJ66_010820 [Kickxella alabastrina]|uniref:Uncharacterized protein n=1 Tax=Kickxella alabastrina TaxID=61397 RepID=A0ACC1HZL9_9FUNG|nr:hypothetical protein LPJ66_010820 [Kickxella alabastrina]
MAGENYKINEIGGMWAGKVGLLRRRTTVGIHRILTPLGLQRLGAGAGAGVLRGLLVLGSALGLCAGRLKGLAGSRRQLAPPLHVGDLGGSQEATAGTTRAAHCVAMAGLVQIRLAFDVHLVLSCHARTGISPLEDAVVLLGVDIHWLLVARRVVGTHCCNCRCSWVECGTAAVAGIAAVFAVVIGRTARRPDRHPHGCAATWRLAAVF